VCPTLRVTGVTSPYSELSSTATNPSSTVRNPLRRETRYSPFQHESRSLLMRNFDPVAHVIIPQHEKWSMHDCHTSTSNVNPSSIPCDFAIVYTLCLITCLGNLTPFWKFKLSNIRQPNIERCNYDVCKFWHPQIEFGSSNSHNS